MPLPPTTTSPVPSPNVDFAAAMRAIEYDGYTGYELCHPLPNMNGVPAGLDFVDRNARLAARFMRQVLAEAQVAAPAATT